MASDAHMHETSEFADESHVIDPDRREANVTGLEGKARIAHFARGRYEVVSVGDGWDVYADTEAPE